MAFWRVRGATDVADLRLYVLLPSCVQSGFLDASISSIPLLLFWPRQNAPHTCFRSFSLYHYHFDVTGYACSNSLCHINPMCQPFWRCTTSCPLRLDSNANEIRYNTVEVLPKTITSQGMSLATRTRHGVIKMRLDVKRPGT